MLKAYYGDLREFGSWTADEFTLTTGATFRAIGALESPVVRERTLYVRTRLSWMTSIRMQTAGTRTS